MKITRKEAFEYLELHDGATTEEIRTAYKTMSMRWHPDRNPEEKKQEATERFQKINASYAKLAEQGPGSDDDDDFFSSRGAHFHAHFEDVLFEMFFRDMARGRGPGFFGFSAAYSGFESDDYSDDYYDDDTTDEEEEDITAAFFRRAAQQAYNDARASQAERQQRDTWMNQFRRLATVSVTQRSIRVNADSKRSRLLNFPDRKFPSNYFWELQYRPAVLHEDQNPSSGAPVNDFWSYLIVRNGLQATISDLTPGTEYVLRARPCITEENGRVKCVGWNTEARITTQAEKKKTKKKTTPLSADAPEWQPASRPAADAPAAADAALPNKQNQHQQPRTKAAKNRAKRAKRKAKKEQASGA